MENLVPIIVNGRQHMVEPQRAAIIEKLCAERYHPLFQLAYDWYKIMINCKGSSVKTEITVGD